ncbi:unnamed protein product [Calypogeia fissa]
MASFSSLRSDVFSREQRRQHYGSQLMGLNAYDRHKKFMHDYVNHYRKGETAAASKLVKTDMDTLRETYRFIRTEEDDVEHTWEQRLAKRYYDKLFKEYCIADMSRYKESKIGLRWRSEKEVISGKGQFICGNKKCNETDGLRSYEVNFAYTESGESKQALVKLRVCPECAYKLNYRKEKELERQLLKEQEKKRKRRRESKSRTRVKKSQKSDDDDTESESGSLRSSGSGDSEAFDEKQHVETGDGKQNELKGMPSEPGDRPAGTDSAEPSRLQSKQSPGKEEFEPFFKDMFL